ncbi:MAG: 16S rRNA (guanine(527)-N(7))-methyltransferase RsmG [Micrococcales bacterium]|nr:16S rRNA (guanine(527)-N(7))-methyltransferase RsmG [Micrococcales bacterium]
MTDPAPRRPGVDGIPMPGAIEPVTGPPPPAPDLAAELFGDRLGLAERYAALLADTGVSHGLIGPREIHRLWERHILNCAVLANAFPRDALVGDVGSGAGLPGLVLAIRRPDLSLHLIEPMLRRTTWLEEAVGELGLDNVTVVRGRAEDVAGSFVSQWVTARAVARIDKLARWCFPLVEPGGHLVAMKGASAGEELEAERPVLARLGAVSAQARELGGDLLETPTYVIDVEVGSPRPARPQRGGGRGRKTRR